MLTEEEMIEGEIYFITTKNLGSSFIFKKVKENYITSCDGVINTKSKFYEGKNHVTGDWDIEELRIATEEEKEHLLQCIEANEYIEYIPKLNKELSYDIF